MIVKLNRLKEATQHSLKQLACVGNSAKTATLNLIYGETEEALHTALWEAVSLGFVVRSGDIYSFAHDRIQQAAYSLIPEEGRAQEHLKIGRLLSLQATKTGIEDGVFDIVNHLNRGMALLTSQDEREHVAELNLAAGKRAKASTAYASALSYFSVGRELLVEESWDRCYELTFSLDIQQASCELLNSNFVAAEELIAELLRRAKSRIDRAATYRLKIELQVLKAENERSVETALECLRLFGIEMSPHPDRAALNSILEDVFSRLANQSIESLVDLPRLTDAEVEAAMDVLTELYVGALITDENLTCLNLCHMVLLTLEHGTSGAGAFAFGLFGVMLGHFFGRYQDGYRFSTLARSIVKRHGFAAYEAKTLYSLELASLWTRPITEALDAVRASFRAANERGDITYACYACPHTVADMLVRGDPLDVVWKETERGIAFVRAANFRDVADDIVAQQQFIRNMRGQTSSHATFDGEDFDQCDFERELTPDRISTMVCWYWIIKGQARYLFGDYEEASHAFVRAQPLLWSSLAHIQLLDYHLFSALTLTALTTTPSIGERSEQLKEHCGQLARWAESYPPTFGDKHALVSAEIARLEGREADAMRLYEQAIRLARENGFVQIEGVAHEVAARFYAARGFETIADAYLRNAKYCYLRWGANGKVMQLNRLYPHLVALERQRPAAFNTAIGSSIGQMDVETVVKASQALRARWSFRN